MTNIKEMIVSVFFPFFSIKGRDKETNTADDQLQLDVGDFLTQNYTFNICTYHHAFFKINDHSFF